MSEKNQTLLIVCLTVVVIGWLRLYFGYKTWEWQVDLTSVATIGGGAMAGLQLAELFKK